MIPKLYDNVKIVDGAYKNEVGELIGYKAPRKPKTEKSCLIRLYNPVRYVNIKAEWVIALGQDSFQEPIKSRQIIK